MHQRWLAKRSQRPAAPRVRDRKNKHGRRGGPNRCGHDREHFIRPDIKRNLPPFVYWVIQAFDETVKQRRLPSQLNFRFHSRSERDETIQAMVPVMVAATIIITQQIGRPSKKEKGAVDGLTIDYDLAPLTQISESRIERGISTLKDWGWQHFETRKLAGGRERRCASQPIDETETGERRGRAAIRAWTPRFYRDIGISQTALKQAISDYQRHQALQKAGTQTVVVEPLLEELADHLWDPTSKPRPPP